MIGENKYKYIDGNVPKVKINYSYSKYLGLDFIEFWKFSREEYLKDFNLERLRALIGESISVDNSKDFVLSKNLFSSWIYNIDPKEIMVDVNLLVKRFEVTKKIYDDYNVLMRPSNKDNYLNFENYCLFGITLGLLFSKTKNYQYLNALLKLNDILLGWNTFNLNEDSLLLRSYSLDLEYKSISKILNQKNINND